MDMERLNVLSESEVDASAEAKPWSFKAKTAVAAFGCVGILGSAAAWLPRPGAAPVPAVDARSVTELALIGHNTGEKEEACLALKASIAAYTTAATALSEGLPAMAEAADNELVRLGYHYERGWTSEGATRRYPVGAAGKEHLSWWKKGGACVLAFQGEDSAEDLTLKNAPLSKWELDAVNEGLGEKLGRLLFGHQSLNHDMWRMYVCESATVTGHSLGGALAQIFSTMTNWNARRLQWKVEKLYAFGAMPAESTVDLKNHEASDGCFAGALYFMAQKDSTGAVCVDTVKNPSLGAPSFKPLKNVRKVLFFKDKGEAPMEFACGEDLPEDIKPCLTQDMHDPSIYASHLGCGEVDDGAAEDAEVPVGR